MIDKIQEIYRKGLPFAEFLSTVRSNADRFRFLYEHLAFVRRDTGSSIFPADMRILVLCEPYCGDVVVNLPLIARLAEASGNTNLRIASRDAHQSVADAFPGRGGISRLPTIILLGPDWEVLGYWSERSRSDEAVMSAFTRSDPLPEITLDDGTPAGEFKEWLERRLSVQLPIFCERNWKDVRAELRALAAARPSSSSTLHWRVTLHGVG